MRRLGAAVAGLLLWGAAGVAGAEATLLQAAVLPPEARVGRQDAVEGGAVVRLRAARGERQPALVALRSSADARLTARATALYGPGGASIPAAAVELDRVEYVPGPRGEVADRLEPWSAAQPVAAQENALAWVEVAVPADAAPGFYHGEVVLSGPGAERKVPVELEVLPFSLPATPSLATSFGLAAQGERAEVARTALRERVTVRVVSPPPFRVVPGEGTLALDFTQFDADLEVLLGGSGPRPSSVEVAVPRRVPAPRRVEYLLAVKRHLAEQGLGDLLVNFSEEGSLLDHVTGAAPGFALISTEAAHAQPGRFWWRLGEPLPGAAEVGKPVAALDCAGCHDEPQPDWLALGATGSQVRSLGWAAFRAGAAGLYDPRKLDLLYPAADGGVRESVRLKLLRKGLEDYEYLRLASLRSPERAQEVLDATLPPGAPQARRPVDFEAGRDQLAKLIALRRFARPVKVP